MARTLRDGYSNFSFFQAYEPQDLATGARINGVAVDTRGYDTATIVVNIGDNTGGGAFSDTERWQLMLEHYNSVAGAWSECYPSQMIHSVVGMAGAYSTLNSGIFASITSANQSQTHAVGYKGPHRSIRLAISEVGTPSVMSAGAIAILGLPGDWPVMEPVGD